MRSRIITVLLLTVSLQTPLAAVSAADRPEGQGDRTIPYKRTGEGEPDTGVSAARVILGLGLVMAIGLGTILAIRRFLPASYGAAAVPGARHIDLLEVRRLTPRLTLFLLNIDGEKIVLAQTSETLAVHRLHSCEKDIPDAS